MTAEQFEMLIRVSEKTDLIYEMLANHLEHHFIYTITLFSIVIGLTGVIIKLLLNKKKT
jgi:hypothetical protein